MIANRYFIMSHTDIHLHAHLNMLTDVPSLRNSNILKAKFRDRLLQRRLTLYTLLKNKQIISKFIANYFQTGLISVRSYKSHCCFKSLSIHNENNGKASIATHRRIQGWIKKSEHLYRRFLLNFNLTFSRIMFNVKTEYSLLN